MQLINFIVCDDVRTEINGRMSLMGTYGYEMKVQPLSPDGSFWLRFGAFLQVKLEPDDPRPDSLLIEVKHNGEGVIDWSGPIDARDATRGITLGINAPLVKLRGFGDLSIDVTLRLQDAPLADPYRHVVHLIPMDADSG